MIGSIRPIIAVRPLGLGFWLCLSCAFVQADPLSFNSAGLHVDGGSMGVFDLEYPELQVDGDQRSSHKILQKTPAGATTLVQYEGGVVLSGQISADGVATYTFTQIPDEVRSLRYNMLISFSYQQGGKWKVQDGAEIPFPVEKPPKPHLFQDHATQFQLINFEGRSLNFHFPEYSYVELTDNREWNWPIYDLVVHCPISKDRLTCKFTITPGAALPGAKPTALVDEIGQINALDWPDKVKSLDDLKADVKSEQDYYAGLIPPVGDKFGGLPDSGSKMGLTASGFFHVEKKGASWALVDPAGNLFFHLGVCGVGPADDQTLVAGRESTFAWLPSADGEFKSAYRPGKDNQVFSFHLANMIRKYGQPYSQDDFTTRMIQRLRKWGFNSIGAFSDFSPASVTAENFPYVISLPLNPWASGIQSLPGITQTWDPYDADNVAKVEKAFSQNLPAHADDPLLIGYFLVNEPLYEDIPKVVPGLKGSSFACKRELVRQLRDKYKSIDAFNSAWGTSSKSFDELNDTPLTVATPAASGDVHDFTGKFLDTYFKLVSDTYHKYDAHHMLIGNRLQPGTINNEQLCRIAGKYLDVMSFNYYTDIVDKDFLKRIYQWTGRPMFLSEFYWSSGKESGLAGGREAATQQERGLAYRNYVEQSASLGYVLGIEWFTLVDQAATGRWFEGFGGERANTGLLSVADRPWKPMLAEMMKTNDTIYQVELGQRPPFAFDNPRFAQAGNTTKTASVPHARGSIAIDGATANWPGIPPEIISGNHLVTGADSGGVEGIFKLCWDETNLYVLVAIVDPTPLQNKMTDPNLLWNGDALELFLGSQKLDAGGQLLFSDRHFVIGAGNSAKAPYHEFNSPQPYSCVTLLVPGSDGKGYTLEAAIPWDALGVKPKAGIELLFDLAIDDSTDGQRRQRQITWNGTDKNSIDRTHWGRLKLLP